MIMSITSFRFCRILLPPSCHFLAKDQHLSLLAADSAEIFPGPESQSRSQRHPDKEQKHLAERIPIGKCILHINNKIKNKLIVNLFNLILISPFYILRDYKLMLYCVLKSWLVIYDLFSILFSMSTIFLLLCIYW